MNVELKPELVMNAEQRCACVLLLDTSGSMQGERIAAVNSGLKSLIDDLRSDPLASKRVDLAIMTFDSEIKVIQDFSTPDKVEAPALTAQAQTFMGAAITEALNKIEARKQEYRDHGIPYYRPWLFLLTDGEPAGEPASVVEDAQRRLQQAQKENRVKVFPIGVGEGVNMARLAEITSPMTPLRLNERKFSELFDWLSKSLAKVSQSKPGEQIALAPPGWRDAA
jgi:uncharacterized protein YegL